MTSGNGLRAALVAVALAGCGEADDAGAPGSVAGEGPARPGAGGDDLVVDALPLDAPAVLDPVPDGLRLTDVSYYPPEDADIGGTLVRGVPGSAGDMRGSAVDAGGVRARIWAQDGLVLAVDGNGIGKQPLDEAVRDLRPGSWAEFEAMDGEILDRPPTPEESGRFAESGFVSGVYENMRWAFALHPEARGSGNWSTCTRSFPPPAEKVASSRGGGGGGTGGVTVTTPDGRTLEAQLSDVGPRPGERTWGMYIPRHAPPPPGGPPTTVTAYDVSGDVLDRRAA